LGINKIIENVPSKIPEGGRFALIASVFKPDLRDGVYKK